ncbi:septum formation family protein [Ruania suaedae]|uniref:septum formation family protein n=1 Tax=Ruania suaedae TaxID=2897774 RepID=UPI001E4C2503|nr:septum formation family protein [Ruania suaedae]UFU02696.1 septum formation family protein [Ruania suaedae]
MSDHGHESDGDRPLSEGLPPPQGRHAGSWAGPRRRAGSADVGPTHRQRRSTGTVPAVVAVLSGLALLATVLVLGLRHLSPADPAPTTAGAPPSTPAPEPAATPAAATGPAEESDTVSETDLTVGLCLEDYELGAEEITRVECSAPHRFEVFAQERLSDEEYPGEEDVMARGEEFCRDALLTGLPDEVDMASIVYRTISPSPATWEAGERTLTCIVGADSGHRLSGSFTDDLGVTITPTR